MSTRGADEATRASDPLTPSSSAPWTTCPRPYGDATRCCSTEEYPHGRIRRSSSAIWPLSFLRNSGGSLDLRRVSLP